MRFLKSNRRQMSTDYGSDEPDETIVVNCRICGGPMAVPVPAEGSFLRESVESMARMVAAHDECKAKRARETAAARAKAAHEEKMASWEAMCPAEFRKRINPNADGYSGKRRTAVEEWTYGETGLLLIGPSGRCKTRFAWMILGREHRKGRKVAGLSHVEFRQRVSALASSDSLALLRLVSDLAKADLLLLDDLGKGRSTPAAEEALFDLVNARSEAGLPTIYTANLPIENFAGQISEEYRDALIRRIVEKTRKIQF